MEASEAWSSPRLMDLYGSATEGGTFAPRKAPSRTGDQRPQGGGSTSSERLSARSTDPELVRVLVVDDQPDVLTTTVELFKLMGYEVLSASNGLDALAILQSTPDIQVLFSDVVMPGMNGFKLGKEARQLIPGINVILASGFQGEAMAASGADTSDFHFLVKPYRMADVARLLRK